MLVWPERKRVMCAQIIDDTQGNTLAASSSLSPALREVLKEVGGATTVHTEPSSLQPEVMKHARKSMTHMQEIHWV